MVGDGLQQPGGGVDHRLSFEDAHRRRARGIVLTIPGSGGRLNRNPLGRRENHVHRVVHGEEYGEHAHPRLYHQLGQGIPLTEKR